MKRSQDVDFDALFDSLRTEGDDATSPADDWDDSADEEWDDAEDE
jgi:hypothetical protein